MVDTPCYPPTIGPFVSIWPPVSFLQRVSYSVSLPVQESAQKEKKQSLFESVREQAQRTNTAESPAKTVTEPVKSGLDSEKISHSESSTPEFVPEVVDKIPLSEFTPDNWLDAYQQLAVSGILQSTVSNCVYLGCEGDQLNFLLDKSNATLYSDNHQERFATLLSEYFGRPVSVAVTLGQVSSETPALRATRLKRERHQHAVELVQSDPLIQQLVNQFAVVIDPEKIEPLV